MSIDITKACNQTSDVERGKISFKEKMSDLMAGLEFVYTFLDDLLNISISTFGDHLYCKNDSTDIKLYTNKFTKNEENKKRKTGKKHLKKN